MNTPSQVGEDVMSRNELGFIVGNFILSFFVIDLSCVFFKDGHVVISFMNYAFLRHVN